MGAVTHGRAGVAVLELGSRTSNEVAGRKMPRKIAGIALGIAIACFAAIVPARVAAALEPIYSVVDHPFSQSSQRLSMDAIGRAIMAAGRPRGWQFEPGGPGELLAIQQTSQTMAKVKVTYSQTAYSITLVEASMYRRGNQIEGRYNRWVRNLESDIANEMAAYDQESK
jgi:hypothetical protein